MEKKIKLGILGAGRGESFAGSAEGCGFELVAICDKFEPLLQRAERIHAGKGITFYKDFDKFLEHDMDAVVVANYATEHAPYAIKALKAGKHVMSECMAMFTMAEGVELVEAVEKSGKVYYFAENYPFICENLEMARLFKSGAMGKFLYGEAEYVHPIDAKGRAGLTSGPEHWRAWLPVTYYCTHSMGPIMYITDSMPVQVNGLCVPHDFDDPIYGDGNIKTDDVMSILMCTMDNGALAKVMPCAKLRDHGNRCRICCNKGSMEWTQGFDRMLRVHREQFDWPADMPVNTYYHPNFPAEYLQAANFGHGGGDFFTSYFFHKAIVEGSTPVIDVYKAVAMSAIGIQGFKSALQKGAPMEIPDFHKKEKRDEFRNDDWNPDPARHKEGYPYPSILGKIEVSEASMAAFRENRRQYESGI